MRVAVTSQGDDLAVNVDPRFGRASKFLLIDTETMSFEVIENRQSLDLPQGAGIQTAQNIAQHNPDVVLTGNCGPKAFKALQAAGVEVVVGVAGVIKDAVQAYVEGRYQPAKEANVEGHWA
ncbi:MAG: NifB/NifX family molybdenum-iron cluster-binding protein [Desulfobacteraceae bacterium]|nr:NifB/NifX family molybdenum-iron cluster-binding protein [Desulfobacteraceae bacterium]